MGTRNTTQMAHGRAQHASDYKVVVRCMLMRLISSTRVYDVVCVSCTLSNNNELEPFLIRHRVQHVIKCHVAVSFFRRFVHFLTLLRAIWLRLWLRRVDRRNAVFRLLCFLLRVNGLRMKQRKWRRFFLLYACSEASRQCCTIESTIKIICCHRRLSVRFRFAHLPTIMCIRNNITSSLRS